MVIHLAGKAQPSIPPREPIYQRAVPLYGVRLSGLLMFLRASNPKISSNSGHIRSTALYYPLETLQLANSIALLIENYSTEQFKEGRQR
jgi:hypothetical protein